MLRSYGHSRNLSRLMLTTDLPDGHYVHQFLLLVLASSCSRAGPDTITRDDCQRVREHSADLRLEAMRVATRAPNEGTARELQKHRKNFSNAGGEAYLDKCVEERDLDWVECSLSAKTSKALQKCN